MESAAPILFDVFNLLPRKSWFQTPLNDLEYAEVCTKSGYLAQEDCPKTKQLIPRNGTKTAICPYHKLVHLNATEQYRVNSICEKINQIVNKKWFVLPPVMEWYYKNNHIDYKPLPPFRSDCQQTQQASMDFIYPKNNSKIYLTKDFNSKIQPVILKVAHTNKEAKLYWYVDNQFKGTTQTFHEMQIEANTGFHYITVEDDFGNEITRKVEMVRD